MHIAIILFYDFVSIQVEVGAFEIGGEMCNDFTGSKIGVFHTLFLHGRFSERKSEITIF